jgi:hypothetical protein
VESYANYIDLAAKARTVRPLLAFQFERFTLTYRFAFQTGLSALPHRVAEYPRLHSTRKVS